MTSLFRTFFLALMGIVCAIFGIYHAATTYPASSAFATVSREFPAISAVASFYFGISLALLGLLFLIPVVWQLRRSPGRKVPVGPGGYDPRTGPDHREDDRDLDPDADPYGYDPEEADYDRNRRRGGYEGYAGTSGRNGRFDPRQLAGARR
jgi:hypothetical protein